MNATCNLSVSSQTACLKSLRRWSTGETHSWQVLSAIIASSTWDATCNLHVSGQSAKSLCCWQAGLACHIRVQHMRYIVEGVYCVMHECHLQPACLWSNCLSEEFTLLTSIFGLPDLCPAHVICCKRHVLCDAWMPLATCLVRGQSACLKRVRCCQAGLAWHIPWLLYVITDPS